MVCACTVGLSVCRVGAYECAREREERLVVESEPASIGSYSWNIQTV